MSKEQLLQRLQACVDDPMWADHAEISKATLREVIVTLTRLLEVAAPVGNRTHVDSGALTMALNVLRRAGKDGVADALESTASRAPVAAEQAPAGAVEAKPDSVHLGSGAGGGVQAPTVGPREIAKFLRSVRGMGCNCDLDNWEPERSTGHSHVCRIHKAAIAADATLKAEVSAAIQASKK